MVKCCVPGCGATGSKIFHSFPANQELRQMWIDQTKTFNLNEKELKSYAKVCRYHFRETDFVVNQRNQRGLKANTVPSLRLPPPETIVAPTATNSMHTYCAKDKLEKLRWKRRHRAEIIPSDFQFDVQCMDIYDDSFSVESNQDKDRDFEKFKAESVEGKRRIRALEEELRICKQQLRNTEKKLDSSNKKLKKARQEFKQIKLNRKNVFRYLRTVFSGEQLAFFNMQLRNKGRKPAGRRYTPEEKSLALILYKHSPKNYRFMRKIFVLPSKRTLGRHSAQLMFTTGVNEKIFELITEKAKNLSENGRYCALSWDEISLKSHLDYNVTRDEIDGFLDFATLRKPVFATHALTFMVRGIADPWKQAIGYFFTDGLKSFELVEMIKLMTKAVLATGLRVMMSVCDQVYVNAKAVRELVDLNLPTSSPSKSNGLLSYKIGTTTIIHCYDPPHIIKGIRNNLITKYLRHKITKRFDIDQPASTIKKMPDHDRLASWDHVERFYDWSNRASSVKLLPKLSPEHINPDKSKMKVNVATQVFSQTVGNMMLKHSFEKELPRNISDTAHVLLFFNDVFDSINTSRLPEETVLKGPVTQNSVHFVFWNYALKMLSTMQYIDPETGKATNRTSVIQKLESTILGFMEICRLCLNLNIEQIALRNMNQDCLENFFGNIRSCCHNSKSVIAGHFRAAFTTVFMTNSIAHSMKSNCEPDTSIPLLADIHLLMLKSNNVVNREMSIEHRDNSQIVDSNTIAEFDTHFYDPIIFEPEFSEKELDVINEEAISNLSKSVFNKLLEKIQCEECRSTLETASNLNDDSIKFPSYLFTQNFQKLFCYIDESLQHICEEKSLKKEVFKSLTNVVLDRMGCEHHFHYVESKFKEFSTIFGIISFCKRINDILSGKNKIYSDNFNSIEQLAFTFRKKKKRIGKHSEKFE